MAKWATRLIHPRARAPGGFRSLVSPVYRGSTTLFETAAEAIDHWNHDEAPYSYGLYGTPTTLELAARICELEGGWRTFLTPGGQSAFALIDFGILSAGDHMLILDSVYGPNLAFTGEMLTRFGVTTTVYPATVGAGIAEYLQANTRLVWCETPGSVTMEVQDVPAIAKAAHDAGALVALDNTYAAGILFDAFAHGVDITMQALTKYVGGHSDLLMGSVTVLDKTLYARLGAASQRLGFCVSPDDCALALRGLSTLGIRLRAIEASALMVARWLEERPEVERVLHPALASSPGHELWSRDFTGSAGVFSIVLKAPFGASDADAFVDRLRLFQVGYSWGGVHSLAVPWRPTGRPNWTYGGRLIRLNIGLENPADLIGDLAQALDGIRSAGRPSDVQVDAARRRT